MARPKGSTRSSEKPYSAYLSDHVWVSRLLLLGLGCVVQGEAETRSRQQSWDVLPQLVCQSPGASQEGQPANSAILTGSFGEWTLCSVNVPEGVGTLEVTASAGVGDADASLYVTQGSPPERPLTPLFPEGCSSVRIGTDEACLVPMPEPAKCPIGLWGTWKSGIPGIDSAPESFADVKVTVTFDRFHLGPDGDLEPGVTAEHFVWGPDWSWRLFRVDLPSDLSGLEVSLTGGNGRAGIYAMFGDPTPEGAREVVQHLDHNHLPPNLSKLEAACAVRTFDLEKHCVVPLPEEGTWYLAVNGIDDYADVRLEATVSAIDLELDEERPLWVGSHQQRVFRVSVPEHAALSTLDVMLREGSQPWDPVLSAKRGEPPTDHRDADCFDFVSLDNDGENHCIVEGAEPGDYYVVVDNFLWGYATDATLKATVIPAD